MLELFFKIEGIYNKLVFKGYNNANDYTSGNSNSSIVIEEEKKSNISSILSDASINSPLSPSSPSDLGLNYNSYRSAEISELYEQLNIGYLIPLTCGHNGKLSEEELKIYHHHLMNSNLITI